MSVRVRWWRVCLRVALNQRAYRAAASFSSSRLAMGSLLRALSKFFSQMSWGFSTAPVARALPGAWAVTVIPMRRARLMKLAPVLALPWST